MRNPRMVRGDLHVLLQVADGVADHVQVLLQRALQHRLHVQVPCLTRGGAGETPMAPLSL